MVLIISTKWRSCVNAILLQKRFIGAEEAAAQFCQKKINFLFSLQHFLNCLCAKWFTWRVRLWFFDTCYVCDKWFLNTEFYIENRPNVGVWVFAGHTAFFFPDQKAFFHVFWHVNYLILEVSISKHGHIFSYVMYAFNFSDHFDFN